MAEEEEVQFAGDEGNEVEMAGTGDAAGEKVAREEQNVSDDDSDSDYNSDEGDVNAEVAELQSETAPADLDEQVHKLGRHKKKSSSNQPTQDRVVEKKRLPRVDRPEGETNQDLRDTYSNMTPEERKRKELEDKLDAALKSKPKRTKKMNEDDLEMMQDENIAKLRDKMREAAYIDAEAVRDKTVATAKLKLLPEVTAALKKSNLADSILDNNLLESIRIWLEPLSDASIPSYTIQKELFDAIVKLPIKKEHLRESGLGKVMIFYQRSNRVEPSIRRMADKLVSDWTRPIMGRSDNYRTRHIETKEYRADTAAPVINKLQDDETRSRPKTLAEESAMRRNRAAIPTASHTAYKVAPRASIAKTASSSKINDDEQYKRIRMKMANRKKSNSIKKAGVSIEGRGLSMK